MIKWGLFSLAIFITFVSWNQKTTESVAVTNLKTESLNNPFGIDVQNPRLSWKIKSENRNIEQTAYQIIVASSIEKLAKNEGDFWNSGKVQSNKSVNVIYSGNALKKLDNCYWKVKVWTINGESEWSNVAQWIMGFLNYKDWTNKWIGFDKAFPGEKVEEIPRLAARYFRKEFQVKKEIKRASAHIMGLGWYELYINGKKTGDYVLSPSPTDYTKNVKYNSFDVTQLLKEGGNAIGVVLGSGRYFTMRQHYKSYKIKNFGFPKLNMHLVIDYTDGSREEIKTDDSWKGTANGPVLNNNEYDGEEYDARKEMPGWNSFGFNDSEWLSVEYVEEPGGDFEAQMNENMKVMRQIQPVSIQKRSGTHYIVDMGQNMVGWIKLSVNGSRGDSVQLRFAEILDENEELETRNLREAKATDLYILKGNETETWEPGFTYHGFRYVEVSGFRGEPKPENFIGQVVYDAIATTATFQCSDSTLNQVFRNAWWSISGNYKGMPVDCPQRDERQPWLGDRAIGSMILHTAKKLMVA